MEARPVFARCTTLSLDGYVVDFSLDFMENYIIFEGSMIQQLIVIRDESPAFLQRFRPTRLRKAFPRLSNGSSFKVN